MTDALNPLLGFAAGALTILSPCVLPLIPVVLAGAGQANPRGPLALAGGLVASFTLTGFLIAIWGANANFDPDLFRNFGAILLAAAGILLLFQRLQDRLSLLASPLASWAYARQKGLEQHGLLGQAGIGVLLGLVWSPCVGPTLGAATVLASQGKSLGAVAATMGAFGLGIATVLMAISYAARATFARRRASLLAAGNTGKRILGAILLAVGVLILTGLDRILEGFVLEHLPSALIDMSVML